MATKETRSVGEGVDAVPRRSLLGSGAKLENRRKRRASAASIFDGMMQAHFENHPDTSFDYLQARRRLGITKQWMSKLRQELEARGYPLPESSWKKSRVLDREVSGDEAASTEPAVGQGVLLEMQAAKPRGLRTTSRTRLLNMLQTHLEDDADKPFDYQKARRILGISDTRFADLKKSIREAGFPLPTSTIEYTLWLRRQAGIPKKPSSAVLRKSREERRAKRKAATRERKKLINAENSRKRRSKKRLSNREAAVRNLYYLRYTYPEIGKWIRRTPSQVNHILERLEDRDEIARRLPREKKKQTSTNSF